MPDSRTITIETKDVCPDKKDTEQYEWAEPGNFVLLKISDSGIGINNEILQHIFEPFYTTKEIGKGTGLGLATVYGIVKQSGGHIWVSSDIGIGMTFEVHLPQVSENENLSEEPQPSEQLPNGTTLILLVEDEQRVRNLTRKLLEFCGYTVIEARNGVEALEICEKSGDKIDLVMTDVVMPQMGGRELTGQIAEQYPHIKLLFTSGYTDELMVKHDVNEANTDFIHKPFTLEALALKVRKVLDMENKSRPYLNDLDGSVRTYNDESIRLLQI